MRRSTPWKTKPELFVRAAEIGPFVALALFDDAAPDGAGAGEQVEQALAVAPADRALERGQILREALEHLQHRFLVGEEDVAPHRGVRGGDAGEIAEAAG